VGHMHACMELHIVFFWVFQFLLLIIQIGWLNICLIDVSES
jgi:hypothetical protein